MKAALVSLGSVSSEWTLERMRNRFETADNINIKNIEVKMNAKSLEVLYEGAALQEYDCIYAKGSFRYAPLLRSLTFAFYDKAYMPIKPNSFTIGHDKLLTHLALQYNKIPMPDTYLASTPQAAKNLLSGLNYPIVLKFPHGTQGKGVMFADSFASASSMLDALETLRQPFLIQEYLETGGVDVRAFVIGDKVVASTKRKAVMGEKRANIHAGAKGEAYTLDMHAKKIAINAAKAVGAEICAVDILESHDGPQVIEVNLSPGLQGITNATNIDVADKIAEYLFEQAKKFREKGRIGETDKIMKELESKAEKEAMQQIITNLDFRSDRILLPKLVTQITKFDEKDEFVVKAEKGKVVIEKYS
ncbi:RimK family alpha-L-glutamate ligase [Candidatus Woesearchaeota archaeon]|nr:RimK family alpha-L-glutamate ligase [Candidatus Woesearchaeota archaeon]